MDWNWNEENITGIKEIKRDSHYKGIFESLYFILNWEI